MIPNISIVRFSYIILILGFALSNCAKKKVKPLEPPMRFYFYNSKSELEILQDTKLPGKMIGKLNTKDNVEVTAVIEVTEKDSTLSYFEVLCPERLKSACDDGKAYFQSKFRLHSDSIVYTVNEGHAVFPDITVGTIIAKSDFDTLNSLRDWLRSPDKIKSIDLTKVNYNLLNTALGIEFQKVDDRLKVINELLLLPSLMTNPNPKDPRMQAIAKRYIGLKEKSNGITLASNSSAEIFDHLKEQQDKILTQLFVEYPVRADSYKGLVSQFNKYKSHYLVTEKLFQLISKNGAYSAKGLPFQYFSYSESSQSAMDIVKKFQPNLDSTAIVANGKLVFKENDGVFFEITQMDVSGNAGSDESLEVISISAEESGKSIGFRIKLASGELILTPLAPTDLLLTSGQGFKEFLATIPKDYKEILKTNPYEKALVLIAAKFGEGGYDETIGEMQYRLYTTDRYWLIYEVVRSHPNIKRDKESSGSFVTNHGSAEDGSCYEDFQWRQPKGEFYVSGIYSGCQGEGGSGPKRSEELCFSESSGDLLLITFSAKDLRSDKPKVDLLLENNGSLCQYINRLVFDSKRFKGESSGE
ncbi:hypothetical protein [Leptospira vanthielii]|uniref:Lipoprotein n=1 Tax=Leptospira vanthielii TaxID=293085 RepID=A0ABY2NUT1_9LEPT|nr:hypothetical protein [Leptospira vanthielii]TGM61757.1 hypothetical protein EHQ95_00160 [Leptospira vanthielii]